MGTGGARQRIVISAVNLVEGGALSILKDCLTFASGHLSGRYDVFALVHRKSLFVGFPGVRFIELPKAKRSWISRLYHEYWLFRRLSMALSPALWISLHDITPNVVAPRRAVYCHNPAPFYRLSLQEAWLEPRFLLFNLLYRWLYRINIRQNDFVVVQQAWLRSRFEKLFGLRNVLVAYPDIPALATSLAADVHPTAEGRCRFVYPAFPRVFKNFEVVCEAARLLWDRGIGNFEVLLTIDGEENRYARTILDRFGHLPPVRFVGRQSRGGVFELYKSARCLVFPSKLETWGMPLTEFKFLKRPILAADIEYAHETIGSYPLAGFFDPDDAEALAMRMQTVIDGTFAPDPGADVLPATPDAHGWSGLFEIMLRGVECMPAVTTASLR